MSLSDELVIWMSSTAMKAPSITPMSASHSFDVTFFSPPGAAII
jgi:hypothetical protein